MKLYIAAISTIFVTGSCSYSETDLEGTYTSSKLKNNIDTLVLEDHGNYRRSLYRKSDNSLILKQEGEWKISSGQLVLSGFHIDYDNVYSESRKFDSGLMGVHLTIDTGPSFDYSAYSDGTLVYTKVE